MVDRAFGLRVAPEFWDASTRHDRMGFTHVSKYADETERNAAHALNILNARFLLNYIHAMGVIGGVYADSVCGAVPHRVCEQENGGGNEE